MKHTLIKLGAGLGLAAASATAFAGNFGGGLTNNLHGFGSAMVYAKSGGTPLFAAYMPSGNQDTDSVILLELTQGTGTAPGTWQYFISTGNLANAANKPGMKYSFTVPATTSGVTGWKFSASQTSGNGNDLLPTGAAVGQFSFWGPIGNGSTQTMSAPDTSDGNVLLQFSYSSNISSTTCKITFNAFGGTDDYMQYQLNHAWAIPSDWATKYVTAQLTNTLSQLPTASIYVTTKSGGGTADTLASTTIAANESNWVGYFLGGTSAGIVTGSTFPVFPTYSYLSVSLTNGGAAGTFTLGSAATKALNACSGAANSRMALNSSGLVVGGKYGMLRIW